MTERISSISWLHLLPLSRLATPSTPSFHVHTWLYKLAETLTTMRCIRLDDWLVAMKKRPELGWSKLQLI